MERKHVENIRDAAGSGPRQQRTYYLTREIAERLNGAAYWALPLALQQAGGDMDKVDLDAIPKSASAMVETALWAEVLQLEERLNGGRPFPPAPGKLATGPGPDAVERMTKRRDN